MSDPPSPAELQRELETLRTRVRELERAEGALAASESQFRALYHHTPAMIHSIDLEGHLLTVSDHWVEVMGYSREEVIGRPSTDFLTEESSRYAREVILPDFFKSGYCKDVPYQFRKKDGEVVDVLLSATSIRDGEGRLERSLAVSVNVTEQKRAERVKEQLEEQLRQAQKMEAMGRLAGGVAHDFNNILTAILAHVELLADTLLAKLPDDVSALQDLEQIEESVQMAANLTRQLLAFSRQQVLQPKSLDFNQTLIRMEKLLRRLISEDIDLVLVTAPGLRSIYADIGQIEQVVMNLVINAYDAMPRGGTLRLETANVSVEAGDEAAKAGAQPGPYVLFTVGDTGSGIDPVSLERIFEPFFTTKSAEKGTGLGLATVYGVVTQAGGAVTVSSRPGEGATFKIFLPVADVPLEPAAARRGAGEEESLGHETILVCEDDARVRGIMVRTLEKAGYTVLFAGDGQEALKLAEAHDGAIELLVADVIMPVMDGRALSEALSGLAPRAATLYVSGYTADIIAPHGVLEEGMELLGKPFSRDNLLRRVREVLATRPPA